MSTLFHVTRHISINCWEALKKTENFTSTNIFQTSRVTQYHYYCQNKSSYLFPLSQSFPTNSLTLATIATDRIQPVKPPGRNSQDIQSRPGHLVTGHTGRGPAEAGPPDTKTGPLCWGATLQAAPLTRLGLKGGSSCRLATSAQFVFLKKGCVLMGSASSGPLPSRCFSWRCGREAEERHHMMASVQDWPVAQAIRLGFV